MNLYMYVRACVLDVLVIYIYIYIYIYIHIYIYICMYVCICVRACVLDVCVLYVCEHVCYWYMHVCAVVCTHINTRGKFHHLFVCGYIHACIHAQVISAGLHMHAAGTKIWTKHMRGDQELAPVNACMYVCMCVCVYVCMCVCVYTSGQSI